MEQEEFYCILKLNSGEEVFSLIMVDEEPSDPLIILQNPVTMKTFQDENSNTFVKIKPLMELSKEDIFFIRKSSVMIMTESTDDKLIEIYKNYIENNNSTTNRKLSSEQVKLSPKMGYLSSVEEARKSFEIIFKSLKGS